MPRKKSNKNEDTAITEVGPDVLLESSLNEVFDDNEIAQMNNLREMENVIAVAKHLNKSEVFKGFNGHCVDCDIKIPKARLNLHKIRCIDCQQEKEDNEKRKRGISVSQKFIPAVVARNQDSWEQMGDNRPDDKLEESD